MCSIVLKATLLDCWKYSFHLFAANVVLAVAGGGLIQLVEVMGSIGESIVWFFAMVLSLALFALISTVYAAGLNIMLTNRNFSLQQLNTSLAPLTVPAVLWTFGSMGIWSGLYLSFDYIPGMVAWGFTGGVGLVWAMVSMYFIPTIVHYNGNFRRAVSASMLLSFDNIGFSFLLLALSPFLLISTFLLFPGLGGFFILMHHGISMRMKKYENLLPSGGKKYDWVTLLKYERTAMERYSWRSIFFPWKT
jgi:hypothetical protein